MPAFLSFYNYSVYYKIFKWKFESRGKPTPDKPVYLKVLPDMVVVHPFKERIGFDLFNSSSTNPAFALTAEPKNTNTPLIPYTHISANPKSDKAHRTCCYREIINDG